MSNGQPSPKYLKTPDPVTSKSARMDKQLKTHNNKTRSYVHIEATATGDQRPATVTDDATTNNDDATTANQNTDDVERRTDEPNQRTNQKP